MPLEFYNAALYSAMQRSCQFSLQRNHYYVIEISAMDVDNLSPAPYIYLVRAIPPKTWESKMAKRNEMAKKSSGDGVTIFTFSNGNKLECKHAEVKSPEMRDKLLDMGIRQKIGDSYAGADSVGEAEHSARAVWSHLLAGEWSQRGEGTPQTSMLSEALHVLFTKQKRVNAKTKKPFTLDEVREVLAEYSEPQRKTLRDRADVAAEMARISAERASVRAREAAEAAKGSKEPLPEIAFG